MRNSTNHYIFLFFLLFSLLVQSCKKNVFIDDSKVITATLKETNLKLIDTAFFKSRQVIELETVDKSLIGVISRIIAFKNKLFIFDKPRQRLFIFDDNGKFISSIYHIGQGPGEYSQITDICFDSSMKQFIFLCSIPFKLIYYDLNGKFIREQKLDDLYFEIKADKSYIYLLRSPSYNYKANKYSIYAMDKKTQSIEPIMEANHEISSNHVDGNEFVSGKNLVYSRRFDNHIYKLQNGKINTQYTIDFGKFNLSETFKNENYGVVEFNNICNHNNTVYGIVNSYETSHFLFFKTNHASIYSLSKKTNIINEFNACFDSKYDIGTTHFLPIEDLSDKIACIYYSTFFDNYKKDLKEKNVKVVLKDISNLANRVNIDSNPVLFIYQFK